MFGVLQVLEELYDGHDKVGVAVPAEHIVDCRRILKSQTSVDFL